MRLIILISAGIFMVASAFIMKKENTVSGNTIAIENQSLYDTKWSLQKIQTAAGVKEVQTKAFIKFNEVKKSAGGNASCNTFGSSFTISNNQISFKNIFYTKMYCEEVQKIEDTYFKQLGKTNRFEIKGKMLLLLEDSNLLLEFTAE